MPDQAGSRPQEPLVRLVYRSRAALPLSGWPLAAMLRAARHRNRREGVTGLLVADGSRYLQWLEGPPAGVAALMRSIALDRRHDSIEVFSNGPITARRFAGWDMRLASDQGPAGTCPALYLPRPLIDGLWAEADRAPGLMATLGLAPWTSAERPRGSALAGMVRDALSPGWPLLPEACRRPAPIGRGEMDRFLADLAATSVCIEEVALPTGPGDVRRHFALLVEPAARQLGELWMQDVLSEPEVTISLGRLQLLVRHLGRGQDRAAVLPHAPAVLVAPMPGEPHALGAVLASEWLWLSGWPHAYEIAATDAALQRRLGAARFDLLDLSLSPAFERLDGAGRLRRRLAAFRAASQNPALRIRLAGRLFADRPWLAGLVGADSVGGTCSGLDAQLLRLVGGVALD